LKGSEEVAEKGWIKTYRKIQDCWIWLEKEPFDKRSAWIDLLLTANHEEVKIRFNGDFITVEKGQILTSIRKLADKWHWSVDKVLRFLRLIESDGMIKKDSDNFRTLITIENYELYQDEPNANSTQAESKQNVSRNKQELRIKNNNNICAISSHEQEELDKNFEIIYNSYPKKKGRAKGYDLYKGWLRGRDISGRKVKLTNKQIWNAIANYKREIENNGTELQFVKQFDTFMNKSILDYVEDEE
jgi:hypothetical protein